ncbi:MAP kinase-interacting serine/threonine-protein kinase [Trichinella spiralis]|uniref:MAP kinase-interacting serine/threonine-protein kinase n=1 Tax=Trichinella spiralis TaxID=6334 RepID=A0ABR3KBN5_TRISP
MFRIEDVDTCHDQSVQRESDESEYRSSSDEGSPLGRRTIGESNFCRDSKLTATYLLDGAVLGRGAFAVVKSCLNRITKEECAMKIIRKDGNLSRIRILREIQMFHMCNGHPNIVRLIEYFEDDNKFYMIFEKMRGGPLLQHIQQRVLFTERDASMVVRDVVSALHFLHGKGIAHRDLKPENILCTSATSATPVKLCDLDLASLCQMNSDAFSDLNKNEMQSPVGSAEFMAPEVVDAFMGEKLSYDKRCDLWSLGVIVYLLLCGYPPFYGKCSNEDCKWHDGLSCADCQEWLFCHIQSGRYSFPEQDWSIISVDAKDLIQHLLVRDADHRYSVDDVLTHPWINKEVPDTALQTPHVLRGEESARNLNTLAENFAVVGMMSFRKSQELRNSLDLIARQKRDIAVVHTKAKSVTNSVDRLLNTSGPSASTCKPLGHSSCITMGHENANVQRKVSDDVVSVKMTEKEHIVNNNGKMLLQGVDFFADCIFCLFTNR